eukprot:jgi/Tetstr1/434559/TSEL_023650.t1
MRPKMKKMGMRMVLVALTIDFGRLVRPMLSSTGTSGVVCANWTCEDFLHFAETVAVLVQDVNKCVARGSGTTDTERAYGQRFLLKARIKFLRACLDPNFPSLPLWRPGFVGQWEAAGANDAVDMFEGTGPGCRGTAVQPGTIAAPVAS